MLRAATAAAAGTVVALGATNGFVDRLLYDGKRRSLYWTTSFRRAGRTPPQARPP